MGGARQGVMSHDCGCLCTQVVGQGFEAVHPHHLPKKGAIVRRHRYIMIYFVFQRARD